MTAKDADNVNKSELVRVDEHTVKAVFKHYEFEREYLKADLSHKERQPDDTEYRSGVYNESAYGVQLSAKVEVLFGMYRVKDEEAHSQMDDHTVVYDIIKCGARHMNRDGDQRGYHKRREPRAVTGLKYGMALDLVIYQQEDAPQKQHCQNCVRGYEHKRYIAAEQADDIAASEQRSVQDSFFELTHNDPQSYMIYYQGKLRNHVLECREHQPDIASEAEVGDVAEIILHLLGQDLLHIYAVHLIRIADVAYHGVLILKSDGSE
jgi:hypothetical protein